MAQPTRRIGDRIPLSPRTFPPSEATPRRLPPATPTPAGRPRRNRAASSSRSDAPPPNRRPPAPAAPQPPKPPKPPRKRRRWGRIILTLLLVAILLLIGAVVAVGVSTDRALRHTDAFTDYPERPVAGSGTTWLLVGSDSRQGLSEAQQDQLATGGDIGDGRTDTILLVHVPAYGADTPATMVSIPRDSYVPIPGYGRDKINAAFSLGGAPLLTQTVEQTTGLRVDHYAEIGFGGFAGVVDALGGVTVCPVEPVDDPLAGINLPAGCQNLGGSAALGYVRSRATPRADLDRMVHQREFLAALLHRVSEPSVWLNPWNWTTIPQAVAGALTIDTDTRVWDLARLGWAMRDATTVTVPIGEYTWADAGQVVIWDHQPAADLFDALGSDRPIPQSVLDAQP